MGRYSNRSIFSININIITGTINARQYIESDQETVRKRICTDVPGRIGAGQSVKTSLASRRSIVQGTNDQQLTTSRISDETAITVHSDDRS